MRFFRLLPSPYTNLIEQINDKKIQKDAKYNKSMKKFKANGFINFNLQGQREVLFRAP